MLKVYKPKNSDDKKLNLVADGWPQPSFRWLIVGSTGCGKSNLIKNILFTYNLGYSSYFDEIYVFSGSLDDCKEYNQLLKEHNLSRKMRVWQKFDNEQIKALIDDIERTEANKKEKSRVLIVFDDQICNGMSHSNKPTVTDELFIRGRHIKLSVIISTQALKRVNQNIRQLNTSHLTVFFGTNTRDLATVADENSGKYDKDGLLALMMSGLKKRYDFVTIDKTNTVYDKGFNELLPHGQEQGQTEQEE